eukprot:scaffold3267_cov112-Isochrysis_galbana.AAC.1
MPAEPSFNALLTASTACCASDGRLASVRATASRLSCTAKGPPWGARHDAEAPGGGAMRAKASQKTCRAPVQTEPLNNPTGH